MKEMRIGAWNVKVCIGQVLGSNCYRGNEVNLYRVGMQEVRLWDEDRY
jgi:hypothetical protein